MKSYRNVCLFIAGVLALELVLALVYLQEPIRLDVVDHLATAQVSPPAMNQKQLSSASTFSYTIEYTEKADFTKKNDQAGQSNSFYISEVELNPAGSDSNNEWIELFSAQEIDLVGDYYFENGDGVIFPLEASHGGYFIIELPGQWLDNTNEQVFLKYKDGSLISQTPVMSDSANNNKTWNACPQEWKLEESSIAAWNNCGICTGDINEDTHIDGADLGVLLANYGGGSGASDLNGDTMVDEVDQIYLLSEWGSC